MNKDLLRSKVKYYIHEAIGNLYENLDENNEYMTFYNWQTNNRLEFYIVINKKVKFESLLVKYSENDKILRKIECKVNMKNIYLSKNNIKNKIDNVLKFIKENFDKSICKECDHKWEDCAVYYDFECEEIFNL